LDEKTTAKILLCLTEQEINMQLSKLAKKPELIKLTIDDEAIVAEYGEAVEFYTWDRQPMDLFLKLASIDQNNQADLFNAVKDLVLDETGKPVVNEELTLPTQLMLRVVTRVVEELGK